MREHWDRAQEVPTVRGSECRSRSSTGRSFLPPGWDIKTPTRLRGPIDHMNTDLRGQGTYMVKWARASPVTVFCSTWFQTQVPKQTPPEPHRNKTPPTHRDATGMRKLALHSEQLRGGRPSARLLLGSSVCPCKARTVPGQWLACWGLGAKMSPTSRWVLGKGYSVRMPSLHPHTPRCPLVIKVFPARGIQSQKTGCLVVRVPRVPKKVLGPKPVGSLGKEGLRVSPHPTHLGLCPALTTTLLMSESFTKTWELTSPSLSYLTSMLRT